MGKLQSIESSIEVSILVPFKNTANYIGECISSIIAQTYTNWELLIVDDHSVDQSLEIVKRYAKLDTRIKLLQSDGNGIIDALQMAFRYSKGQLITRMDSDDIMNTNKIASMVQDLKNKGPGHIALGLVKYFSESGIGVGYKNYEVWLNQLTINGNNFSEIYKECVIPSPCWMTFREDLESVGAFDSNIYPEDYDLTFRFYKKGLKCIASNKTLHLWRDYSKRTSRTHPHYAENAFLDLKLYYFIDISYDPDKNLVLWGAGQKGKQLAKLLQKQEIKFDWICDNPKKIGKNIYGIILKDFDSLKRIKNPQSIICVANHNSKKIIKSYLEQQRMFTMTDYFFFC